MEEKRNAGIHKPGLPKQKVASDICPACGGDLDTGWECTRCGYDAINERGQREVRRYTGIDARIVQHEIDHLDGVCRVGGEREEESR
jgi:hypothetical protein